jgi:hypothetical protein
MADVNGLSEEQSRGVGKSMKIKLPHNKLAAVEQASALPIGRDV